MNSTKIKEQLPNIDILKKTKHGYYKFDVLKENEVQKLFGENIYLLTKDLLKKIKLNESYYCLSGQNWWDIDNPEIKNRISMLSNIKFLDDINERPKVNENGNIYELYKYNNHLVSCFGADPIYIFM
jgi:hypothetical protein